MSIYFTSDLHLGHNKEFLYKPRGFNNIYEHDKAIINNWNKVVKDDDTVIILGDIMLNDINYAATCFNQLTGFKEIILGNHDTVAKQDLYHRLRGVMDIQLAKIIKYNNFNFFLCHYPTICSSHGYEKHLKNRLINLCGHSHTNDPFADWDKGYIYHCELDAHDLMPICIDQIIAEIKQKELDTNI